MDRKDGLVCPLTDRCAFIRAEHWRPEHLSGDHVGRLEAIGQCVVTACDDAQCLAMLVRRQNESLDALLQRLDAVIADAYENDRFTDEVNAPIVSSPKRQR